MLELDLISIAFAVLLFCAFIAKFAGENAPDSVRLPVGLVIGLSLCVIFVSVLSIIWQQLVNN